jgi:hypothetical protein
MNILWAIIVGLVVGAIAKLIMPGHDGGSIFMTILLGIAGITAGRIPGAGHGPVSRGAGRGHHRIDCRRDHPALHVQSIPAPPGSRLADGDHSRPVSGASRTPGFLCGPCHVPG